MYLAALSLERNRHGKVPYLLILLVWLTVLLGPTYLVRYVIYLWYIIPVLLLESLVTVTEKSKHNGL